MVATRDTHVRTVWRVITSALFTHGDNSPVLSQRRWDNPPEPAASALPSAQTAGMACDVLLPRDLPGEPITRTALPASYQSALAADTVHQARVVWWTLHHDSAFERSTVERLGRLIAQFATRQRQLGHTCLAEVTVDDVAAFLWARTRRGHPPAIATVHLRRTALRATARALTALGSPVDDPTAGLALPPKTRSDLRPLDDDEIAMVRIAAATKHRQQLTAMAAVALAEATATTGEIAQLCWRDLDLDQRTVSLPGLGRVHGRTGSLTVWGANALTRLDERIGEEPVRRIVYRGKAPAHTQAAQAAVVNRLARILTRAAITGHDVKPTSLRLWQPARALADGATIEECARQLGHSSLDVTAAQLHYRWQSP